MQKKHFLSILFVFASLCLILSCGQGGRSHSKQQEQAFPSVGGSDAAAPTATDAEPPPSAEDEKSVATLSANTEVAKDHIAAPARAFIRAAELRFRVTNVKNATERIEGLTRMYGGFVARSEQQSQVSLVTSAPISSDSLLEKTLYTVSSTLSLRIPNAYFDTLLAKLQPMTDFLEYRRVSADDVSLSLLTNSLRAKRSRELAGHLRQAIDKNGKKLSEINGAETALTDTQNAADDAEVRNLGLKDKIDFCEVQLTIYQRQMQMERVIGDNSNVEKFRPPFYARLWDAVRGGWIGFWDLMVELSRAWVLWLVLGGIGYFIWKRRRKNA